MKLSISNIGWTKENDLTVYEMMKNKGYEGLEIAPTRIFPDNPYDRLEEANAWAKELRVENGFAIPSMQSIWDGRSEKLFGTDEERKALADYTKKAIDFAESIGCRNLVFGCPRNRNMPEGADEKIAVEFFRAMGEYAAEHNTVIGMEENPPIYNTNYINDTKSALALIETVGSHGFKLNLDVGTMIENGEDISLLKGREHLINHVHISEPGLKPIKARTLHKDLARLLKSSMYSGYVSIEIGRQDNISSIEKMMNYVRGVFNDSY